MESEPTPDGSVEYSDSSAEPSPPLEERSVLCDPCSRIVTSEIAKCNNLQASIRTALWQASYFPSQSELEDTQNRIDELYSQIEAYNHETVRLRKILDMLATNIQAVNRCIEIHKSLSAPIRRLPVDVLIHIFREAFCFDAAPSRSLRDLFDAKKRAVTTPLRLATVCHLWREIIFQNPLLWTSQAYCLRDSTDVVDIAPIYQQKSLAHSLDIFVYSSDIPFDYDLEVSVRNEKEARSKRRRTKEMQRLMEKLDCGRWRRLSWDRENFDNNIGCQQTLQCDWSALEVLNIHPCRVDISEGLPFACAPRLKTLRLTPGDYAYFPHEYATLFPWEQIEDLWIVEDSFDLTNFCSARSLRRLTVQAHRGSPLAGIKRELLACLKKLRLVDGVVFQFLDKTSVLRIMGCLTSLELSNLRTNFSVWTHAEDDVAPPPCPSLQKLVIREFFVDDDTLISLIRAMENLRSLVIIEPPVLQKLDTSKLVEDEDDVLAVLKKGMITFELLKVLQERRLQHVELVLAEDSSLLWRQGDVLDAIEYLHTVSLKSAIFGIRGGVEPLEHTLKRMKELRKGGLQIWLA